MIARPELRIVDPSSEPGTIYPFAEADGNRTHLTIFDPRNFHFLDFATLLDMLDKGERYTKLLYHVQRS